MVRDSRLPAHSHNAFRLLSITGKPPHACGVCVCVWCAQMYIFAALILILLHLMMSIIVAERSDKAYGFSTQSIVNLYVRANSAFGLHSSNV